MAALDSPKRWAVLIGINYYLNDKCLQGAVRDVEAMQIFLQNYTTPIDISMLISKTPYGNLPINEYPSSNRLAPLGDIDSWPTEKNINASLDRVIEMATPGDLVYLHFSGHGTQRMAQVPPNLSGRPTRLAFVILEDSGHSDSYYHREHFQDKLRQMTQKGLLVTVVLDCCFSGGILRGDDIRGAEVRTVAYDPALDTSYTYTDILDSENGFRGSRLLPQWPVDFDPQGYTILTACSPYQEAMEIQFAGTGERGGALSYFLLKALSALERSGIQLMHEALYEDLCIRFRQLWPAQTPMRYGNGLMTFFSHIVSEAGGVFYRGYKHKLDGQIYLDAGDAHGISKGDEFEICPLDSLVFERSALSRLSRPVKAKEVGFLTSQLDSFELAEGLEDGFKAKLITSLSASKISIRLLESAQVYLESTKMLDEYQFLKLCKFNEKYEACVFNVGVGSNGAYEILDASLQKVQGLPKVPLDAHEYLLNVLQHLAQFKYMEAIENRTSCGLEVGSVKIVTSVVGGIAKRTWDDVRILSLENKSQWGLKIINNTHDTIYVAIFNLTPTWKISNILSDNGGCSYLELRSRERSSPLTLEMEVPDSLGRNVKSCEDIIKVFVTTKRTVFPSMILPDIKEGGPVPRGQSSLSSFLVGLIGASRGHIGEKEGWMTRSVLIRTRREEE